MTIKLWQDRAPFQAGDTEEDYPRLVAFPVESEKPAGCVIVCPGGGYARRADHEGEPIARWLNSLGIAAFVLHYRVAPYRHPAELGDCQRAVRWVRYHAEQYNIDPDRIGMLGFSAGGHATAMAGVHYDSGNPEAADPIDRLSSKLNAIVLCYAVISFVGQPHTGSMKNLIGEDAPQQLREHLSGELQVDANTPPTFLWHTAEDPGVKVSHSLGFASALAQHGVPFDLHVYESGRHGLGLAKDHPEAYAWTLECGNWLRKRGFTPEA
ncbi:MAG: esterase/lipase-like protein [Paenibacillus sp.]|nr:esterase/lipase-like protein [Paenibacillus sp.]